MADSRFRFPSALRLKRPADFRRVYSRRRSASDGWLIVYACENDLPHARLGLSVSRKVGCAVGRNRIRRLYREAFRLSQHELPTGVDFILIPRKAEVPSLDVLRVSLLKLVTQLARTLAREARPS